MTATYRIRPAAAEDMTAIVGLIGEAARWLQETKETDQWATPWPNKNDRDGRIAQGIERGLTWMVEDNGTLAGTVTCREQGSETLWTPEELREPAVYVSRLIVTRGHAHRGIGAALIDWAGQHGIAGWGARWIRVDVWTTNDGLHRYYKGQGFTHLRTLEFENAWTYPSGALFQKPTADINRVAAGRFREVSLCIAITSAVPVIPRYGLTRTQISRSSAPARRPVSSSYPVR
jgi:ribosomal protein S18 acetylase RimI-like enzyme